MKFSTDKTELQSAVLTAAKAAASKSPIPALEGLLLEAGSQLKITGYDLKKGIYTFVDADVAEAGSAVLNAKMLCEMIRLLPDGRVTVEIGEDGNASISCGRSNYRLMSSPAADYPDLPEPNADRRVTLTQGLLSRLIGETAFAVSQNESRPVYTGCLIETSQDDITVIACDGYRLALRREKTSGSGAEAMSFIVPGSALSDVRSICGDGDETVSIDVGAKHVSFSMGGTVVITRRLEGEYLNYRRAVPDKFRCTMKINREEMLAAVDRTGIVVDEKIKSPIRLVFGDGSIDFSCVTPLGRAVDVCSCEGSGDDTEIGFNDRYLREALRAMPAAEATLGINTGSSPCVFLPVDGKDNFIYMVLPVRLRSGE